MNPYLVLPFLVVIALVLPLMACSRALSSFEATRNQLPSARAIAVQILIVQALLFGLAWMAMIGAQLSIPVQSLFTVESVPVAAVVVAGSLALAWVGARRRPLGPHFELRKKLREVSATDPLWLAAVLAAAVTEELAYRGVLTTLLSGPMGMIPAALLSATVFGLGHVAQGWRAGLAGVAFALALQVVVFVSGGLLLAMIVHLIYDLGAAWLGRRLERRAEPSSWG